MATDSLSAAKSKVPWAERAEFHELLASARRGETEPLGQLLQWYASYLTILASTQLDHRLRRRVNPSDIVREAMMAAHRDFADFRGQSQGELLGWLRMILIHTLHRMFAAHIKVAKRDVRREVSIDEISHRLEESATNLAAILPSDGESPAPACRPASVRLNLPINSVRCVRSTAT